MPSANMAREWARSQRNILAFIGSLVVDFDEAEELLQETAARVFENADRYDPSRPFLPWAFGVARHVVQDHRRTVAKDRHLFGQESLDQLTKAFEDLSGRQENLRTHLSRCREQLAPRSRQICQLRYEKGLRPREIAARIGESASVVRVWLHRIREQLRECVERRLSAEEAAS